MNNFNIPTNFHIPTLQSLGDVSNFPTPQAQNGSKPKPTPQPTPEWQLPNLKVDDYIELGVKSLFAIGAAICSYKFVMFLVGPKRSNARNFSDRIIENAIHQTNYNKSNNWPDKVIAILGALLAGWGVIKITTCNNR